MNKEFKIGDCVLFYATSLDDIQLGVVQNSLPPNSHKYPFIDEPVVCLSVFNDPDTWERRISDIIERISEEEAMLRVLINEG